MQQPPNQATGGAGSELRSDAKQMGNTAANRVHSELDARKGTAATQAKSVSSAIQRTAGELDEGAPAWLKSTLQQGADQVQRFADALEQKDSRQLVADVEDFARSRPGPFLLACAAAGFAAARVFKAGGEASTGSTNYPPPATSGSTGYPPPVTAGSEPMFQSSGQEPAFSTRSSGEVV